jgi:hypothetical protein
MSGPGRRWLDDMTARFSCGTFARIRAVLRDGEDRTAFVREAVARELEKREAEQRQERARERVVTWIA